MMDESEKPVILVFTTAYKPFVGGAELAIQEITNRLAGEFEFIIITARLQRTTLKEEIYPEGKVVRLGIGVAVIDKLLLPLLGFWYASKILRTRKNILMWGVMISYASIGAWFVKTFYLKIPFVLTVQEGNNEWIRFPSSWWWRIVLKKVDHVICISNFLAERVREKGYKGKISIVPNGVDEKLLEISKPRYEQNITERDRREYSNSPAGEYARSASNEGFEIKQNQIVIFSASRLVYKNGIDILIDAVARLKNEFNFKLVLAGDGEEKQKLKLQSQKLGIESKVEFLGSVPYQQLPEYYAKSDIFARPSRSEGLGTAFLEAMAAGLITIGTPVGGIPDFLEDGKTGFMARPEDVEDLASVIRKVFKLSDEERGSIIKNARAEVENRFLWKNIASQMKDIFTNTLTTNQ